MENRTAANGAVEAYLFGQGRGLSIAPFLFPTQTLAQETAAR
jgi:hypothetical protein